jgi:hypothetical protein
VVPLSLPGSQVCRGVGTIWRGDEDQVQKELIMNRYHKQDITGAVIPLTDPVEAAKKTRQRQRGATHETRPDTTKHRARKGALLSGVASTPRGWGDPSRQPQGHLHRLFASRERDQMKDPRKSWGLSDTCHRELVNSSLSKAKCFNNRTDT